MPFPASRSGAVCTLRPRATRSHQHAPGAWACALLLTVQIPATAQTTQPAGDLMSLLTRLVAGGGPAPTTPAAESAATPLPEGSVQAKETGLLDLHARDIELPALLEMLSYESRTNIVSTTSVKGTVAANLYEVTLEEALAAILTPNKFSFYRSGKTVYVGTEEELAALLPPPVTRVFTLRYISPAEAAIAVKAILGEKAVVVEGGGPTKTGAAGAKGAAANAEMASASGDYLIVTESPPRLAAVAELLAKIDVRPRQVLIESTVLRATLTETNQFGIDFTVLGGIDFQNVNSTSNASADLTTGALPPDRFQHATMNFNTQFTGAVNDGGITIGLINNGVAAFIRALEAVTDVAVVANPKIVALNKQPGEVTVGRRDGYLTTTVTQTAAIQTVEFLETGTQIRFRPVVNDDGTVRLSVHPKDSNGGLTASNLPFEETTEAHADVLVRDGDTVLIGGLFRERSVNSRGQVPVLGSIPLVGLALGNRSDQTVREEVIILLTVHVLKESPAEQAEQRELLNDVERIRVGTRRGLLGTGRERLAQAFYHEALRQLDAGHRGRALLNTRMAIHNQPKHLPALKLYERLTREHLWDDEGSRMRTFIWDLIAPAERPPSPPDTSVYARPRVAELPTAPNDAAEEDD